MPNPKSFGSTHTFPNGDKIIKTKIHGKIKWISYPRFIIETSAGFILEKDEKVLHRDGNKSNNDLTNLLVVSMRNKTQWHLDPVTKNQILTTFYKWSRYYPHCQNKDCKTPTSKYGARGFCQACNSKQRRNKNGNNPNR